MLREIDFDNGTRAFSLENGELSVVVLSYGATVQSIRFAGLDVAGGYDTLGEYKLSGGYQGATIGRCANRIRNGIISYGGVRYVLAKNEKETTHLHGGTVGFDKCMWEPEPEGDSLRLRLVSPDGDEGYPGRLDVCVTYTVADNTLFIRWEAVSDADTFVSLANHTYFNLNGIGSGSVNGHLLTINADRYDMIDRNLIPYRIAPVENTPFDFRRPKTIGQDIDNGDEQLTNAGGYDHNYYLVKDFPVGFGGRVLYKAAELSAAVRMEMFTDMPCMQLYTGNFLSDGGSFSGGVLKKNREALCLETQFEPDSPNRSGSSLLKCGEKYDRMTALRFGCGGER